MVITNQNTLLEYTLYMSYLFLNYYKGHILYNNKTCVGAKIAFANTYRFISMCTSVQKQLLQ